MIEKLRKIGLSCILAIVVLMTGAWGQSPAASASKQNMDVLLYPGISWSGPSASTQTIRVNVDGDVISLPGERYEAVETFAAGVPQEIRDFYSNEQLALAGWESYDAFAAEDGMHSVFYHESGAYLSVDFLTCPNDPGSVCIAIWKSEPVSPLERTPGIASGPEELATATTTFGKISPANGATNVDPTNAVLSWNAYSPTPDKYSYCINEGSACANNDPDWTSTYDRSVTLRNLQGDRTYYWQVKAITCVECTPKTVVYANSGQVWTFRTRNPTHVTVLGNAGVAGAVLSYTDGTARTVTASSNGSYSLLVRYGWSGTITPSKTGYIFTPQNASFTNLTASQTIQNFTAIASYVISGNSGVSGVTLSYINGTPQTVVSNASGNYSFLVPSGWSGTVTPSKASYTFSPVNRSYVNVTSNQTNQNYIATFITYTISGDAGVAGATLTYMHNGPRFALANSDGDYSFTVPSGWSGTVTPYKIGYDFNPGNKTYSNVQSNQTGQDYAAETCTSCEDADTVGVFRMSNGLLYLKNGNFTGYADVAINYGLSGDYPVTGDWDGDGDDTIGVYRNGAFYLRNSNTAGFAELVIPFGQPGDQPVAGDWDNDGDDTIGVYRKSTGQFLLRNSNSTGDADLTFFLGQSGDVAIAGDWNGDGTDTTGVFRPANGALYLKNTNETGVADITLYYGLPGDRPVTGDWDSDGDDTIGVYRNGVFYLRNANTPGFADLVVGLGIPTDMPIAGNWDDKP